MRFAARAGLPPDVEMASGGAVGGVGARARGGARARPAFGPRRAASSGQGAAAAASRAARIADSLRRGAATALSTQRRRLAALALALLLAWLACFHPGDETLRALSDSPLRLMVSRTGVSFGRGLSVGPRARPPKVRAGRTPLPVPRWRGAINLTAEAERAAPPPGELCLVAVLDASPHVVLSDAGRIVVIDLQSASTAAFEGLRCTLFTFVGSLDGGDGASEGAAPAGESVTWPRGNVSARFSPADLEAAAWPVRAATPAGRVAVVSSAHAPSAMASYHVTLRNHREYARSHGYACLLALVPSAALAGRSPKMAKHYALGALAAGALGPWDVVVHLDLDAWFASWAPLHEATRGWPADKELLIPDAGQLWLNSGLLLVRARAPWARRFFAAVLDARHSERTGDGFKRDQPALWATLAADWAAQGALPRYAGEAGCPAWRDACNPDANPVECWHWCFWAPMQRMRGTDGASWHGLASLDAMPHLHVPPRRLPGAPPLHKLCLATCPSALARAPGLLCAALGGSSAPGGVCGPPLGADAVSRCDGAGCLAQLATGGGAWVKHSGHQHWHDALPRCVPLDATQAAARLRATSSCPKQ